VRVDENMGMHIHQTRRDEPSFGADRSPRFVARQGWRDRDDLAAGNGDIHHAAKAGGGIQHVAAVSSRSYFIASSVPFDQHRSPQSAS
jgi:hypothetical protein